MHARPSAPPRSPILSPVPDEVDDLGVAVGREGQLRLVLVRLAAAAAATVAAAARLGRGAGGRGRRAGASRGRRGETIATASLVVCTRAGSQV